MSAPAFVWDVQAPAGDVLPWLVLTSRGVTARVPLVRSVALEVLSGSRVGSVRATVCVGVLALLSADWEGPVRYVLHCEDPETVYGPAVVSLCAWLWEDAS
jgi:hypothetical protein